MILLRLQGKLGFCAGFLRACFLGFAFAIIGGRGGGGGYVMLGVEQVQLGVLSSVLYRTLAEHLSVRCDENGKWSIGREKFIS